MVAGLYYTDVDAPGTQERSVTARIETIINDLRELQTSINPDESITEGS